MILNAHLIVCLKLDIFKMVCIFKIINQIKYSLNFFDQLSRSSIFVCGCIFFKFIEQEETYFSIQNQYIVNSNWKSIQRAGSEDMRNKKIKRLQKGKGQN